MLEQIQINAYSEFEIVITQDEYMRYTDEPEKKRKEYAYCCVTLLTAPLTPPTTLLTPPTTILPLCLTAIRPKLRRSNMRGVGVNLAKLWESGDMGWLSSPERRRVLILGLRGLDEEAEDEVGSSESSNDEVERGVGDGEAGDRRLRMTGKRVKPERKTSLVINTGSLNRLVKLSPVISPGAAEIAELGTLSLDKIFPTLAVT